MDEPTAFRGLESLTDYTIRLVGGGIEIFGVLIIVTGIAWSTYLHLRRPMPGESTEISIRCASADRFYLALTC